MQQMGLGRVDLVWLARKWTGRVSILMVNRRMGVVSKSFLSSLFIFQDEFKINKSPRLIPSQFLLIVCSMSFVEVYTFNHSLSPLHNFNGLIGKMRHSDIV